MRVAVYGGSFDPPHVGHLLVTSWLQWTARADEVWWVPVAGHAFGKALAPFSERLRMCEKALADLPWARVDPIESSLPVPSYSVDTLRALAAAHPDHALRFVIGADVVPETPRWKAWDEIAANYDPIVVGRVGWPTPPGAIDFPGVSSTEVRRRAAAGEPLDALVPASLVDDVKRLYRSGGSAPIRP